jgi:hypothetical protein
MSWGLHSKTDIPVYFALANAPRETMNEKGDNDLLMSTSERYRYEQIIYRYSRAAADEIMATPVLY